MPRKASTPHATASRSVARAPAFRLWAPTAQQVVLLTWSAGRGRGRAGAAGGPHADGAGSRRLVDRRPRGGQERPLPLRGRRCSRPTTGKVETNLVTDPYSVALTLNSTRSVAVDLSDRAFQPALWRQTPAPALKQDVDSTIYELHVRDFSIGDDDRAGRAPRHVPRVRRGRRRHQAPQGARRRRAEHRAPAADLRHRHDRGGPGRRRRRPPATCASLRARQRPSSRPASTRSRGKDALQLGLRPVPLHGPRGLLRLDGHAADGGARVAEFRTMVGGAAPGRPAGRARPGVQPHARPPARTRSRCSTRSCPATTTASNAAGAVETSTCCQNVATEHADGAEAHGRLGRAVGPRLPGRRLPLRPHGPPLAGRTCSPSARRSTS